MPDRETGPDAGASAPKPPSWDFADVFDAEFRDLHHTCCPEPDKGDPPHQVPTVEHGLIGISLSGGGNRSSTFCLGALQAINAAGILKNVHYLSTVSGGGYIGTAMTVGMSANGGEFPFGQTGVDIGETLETRHLRDTSRYLIPNGFRSVISALTIYLRGIVMNIIIILPFLIAAAAVLVWLKPDTASLAMPWSWTASFWAVIRDAAMPASMLGLMIVAGLLVVYAIGVSIVPIIELKARQRVAFGAAVVMSLFGVIVLIELHLWILRMMFVYEHAITASPGASHGVAQVKDAFIATISQAVAWLTPLVLAVLPFLKSIAAKASSETSGGFSGGLAKWASRIALLLTAAVVPLLLWLTVLQLAYWGIAIVGCAPAPRPECVMVHSWTHAPAFIGDLAHDGFLPGWLPHGVWPSYLLAAAGLLLFWPFLNVNSNSLHQLYRDRLGAAFLQRRCAKKPDTLEPADTFDLSEIGLCAPYHLINAALNVPGSSFANRRGRNADFFLFSRNFVGSEATGYVPTRMAEKVNDGLNIGTAMAISGAAAAPNMGMASLRPLSATIALLNVRLGRWPVCKPGTDS